MKLLIILVVYGLHEEISSQETTVVPLTGASWPGLEEYVKNLVDSDRVEPPYSQPSTSRNRNPSTPTTRGVHPSRSRIAPTRPLECGVRSSRTHQPISSHEASTSSSANQNQAQERRQQEFSCEICGKSFEFSCRYRAHMETHRDDRPFQCQSCGKSYKTTDNLRWHMKSHENHRPFKCQICDMSCKTTTSLKMHMRVHSNDRPFTCKICGLKLKTKDDLKQHMRTHNDCRPFLCHLCGASLKTKVSLDGHLNTHISGRTYSCVLCGARFNMKAELRLHEETHSDEKPPESQNSSGFFEYSNPIDRHMDSHAVDEPPDTLSSGMLPSGISNNEVDSSNYIGIHAQSHALQELERSINNAGTRIAEVIAQSTRILMETSDECNYSEMSEIFEGLDRTVENAAGADWEAAIVETLANPDELCQWICESLSEGGDGSLDDDSSARHERVDGAIERMS